MAARLKVSEQVLNAGEITLDTDAVVRSAVDSTVQSARTEIQSEIIDFAAERSRCRAA
ncbi:hypothetical protein AB0O28_33560 [Microbispora sp. NPDC088329]|uniref:hypothetical protein n=1 Tax=Microbispora sp. NPDC088329 TaxID=3154869 RepID=UPI00341A1FDE